MMEMPKISIITISYNAEEFIERTIKSIINQSYPNIEYIIIDGNSKDNTVNIIKQYEKHVDSWISEPDKSHFDAMNKGLSKATGDYVLFMNAGDRISQTDALEEAMKEANGADLIYSNAEYIDEEGNRRPWHKKTPPASKINVNSFLNGMVVCHHCLIVKKEIAPKYRLEPWKVSNDIDWAIRVMKNVKSVHYWDQTFCLYLEGGISAANRLDSVKERFNISVEHFGWLPTVFEHVKIVFQIFLWGKLS